MLVFIIHGVNTQNSGYANALITNIRAELKKNESAAVASFYPYSSFWGNLFNNKKQQVIGHIKKDFSRACELHQEYRSLHRDIYRYQKQRNQIINNFLGDFLIYQNPERGKLIRRSILEQFSQYIEDHPKQNQIHFVAHSLGSLILWDLLFSNTLCAQDPAFLFRKKLTKLDLISITTLGSPLLFLKEMLDLDFCTVNSFLEKSKNFSSKEAANSYKLRWVNVIHSSDLVAYPLKTAVEDEISSEILLCDQYVWLDANAYEAALHLSSGQSNLAMVTAAQDAHSSYLRDNLDGRITARIIAYNLLGQTDKLLKRCVTPR